MPIDVAKMSSDVSFLPSKATLFGQSVCFLEVFESSFQILVRTARFVLVGSAYVKK